MRIGICDDEKEIREVIAGKIKALYPEAQITGFQSGEELLAHKQETDILFLDIGLPKQNGMEIAQEWRRRNKRALLIFVTSSPEYVFQAFDVDAFHYLVKPFTDEKFEEVLRRAVQQREKTETAAPAPEKILVVKEKDTHVKVKFSDIIYGEVLNRKIILHTTGGDVEYYGKMSDLEAQAGEDFFRPHRAYLIHFKYVLKYNASVIYLEKGTALMSKKNYPVFVKQYMRYNARMSERQLEKWRIGTSGINS